MASRPVYPKRPPDDDDTDHWLEEFVPFHERERIMSDSKIGTLPGDSERYLEYHDLGRSDLHQRIDERNEFLNKYGDVYPTPPKQGVMERVIKPIGGGIVDTARDLGRMGAAALATGKLPTLGEVFGQKPKKAPVKPPVQTVTHEPVASAAPPQNVTETTHIPGLEIPYTLARPSVTVPLAPSGAPVSAPAKPKKPTISTTPAKTDDIPSLVPFGQKPDGTPHLEVKTRKRTKLNPEEEDHFKAWYQKTSKQLGLASNPDDPLHKYDYRAFWRAGGQVDGNKHFDSKYKDDDHPNRFVLEGGGILDSKYGRPVPSDQFNAVATPQQKAQVERSMVEAGQSFTLPEESPLDVFRRAPGVGDMAALTDQMQAKQLMEFQQGTAPSPIAGIEAPKPLSLGGAFEEAGKSFARGTGNTSGLVLKGVGLWAKELDKHFGTEKKPDDYATFKLGQKISKWTNETFKGRPDLQKNFLLTTLFEGAGSSVPFLATGFAASAAGAGAGTTAAVTGALAGGAGLSEQAPANATDNQRRLGLVLGSALGATEGVPVAELFRMMNTATGGTMAKAVKVGTVQAIEEAIQEGVQQLGENAVKKFVYGIAGQQLNEDIAEGMGAGGMIGFLTGFMLAGKGRSSAAVSQPQTGAQGQGQAQPQPGGPSAPIPDLGAVPQPDPKTKPPKIGDRVNQEVQRIADQFPMPTLQTKKGEQPKKVIKKPIEAQTIDVKSEVVDQPKEALPSMEPPAPVKKEGPVTYRFSDGQVVQRNVQTKPVQEQPAPQSKPVQERPKPEPRTPAIVPDELDDDMREALDAEEEFEAEEQKPKQKQNDVMPDLGEGARAIVDNMYQAMFDKVQKGDTTEGGQQSAVLQAAKIVHDQGGFGGGVDDFREFAGEIDKALSSGVKGKERDAAINAVVERYAGMGHGEDFTDIQSYASKPVEKPEEKAKFSTTQANLPEPVAKQVKALSDQLEDDDLTEDGREDNPHITVKYGLHGNDAEEVKKVLADEPPITATVEGISIFPATKDRDSDVVKLDVSSEDLDRLNGKIAEALPNTETQDEYKPHITLGYVKPGEGEKYTKLENQLKGQEITLDSIAFSDQEKNAVEIPLSGKKAEPSVPTLEAPASTDVKEQVASLEAPTETTEAQRDRIAAELKAFKANPGKINRAEYDKRLKGFNDQLARLNQELEQKPTVPALEEPAKNAPPERRRSVFLGKHGNRQIEFEDPIHAELFDFTSRLQKAARGEREFDVKHAESRIKRQLKLPDDANVGALAQRYRQSVLDGARNVTAGGTFKAGVPSQTDEPPSLEAPKPGENKYKKPSFSVASLSEGVPTPAQLKQDLRFEGTVKLAADTPAQLRASDVDRVMEDAGTDWQSFKEWILSKPLRDETRVAVKNWAPEPPQQSDKTVGTPSLELPKAKEQTSADFGKGDRVEWTHEGKKLTGIVRTVFNGGNIEVTRTNGQIVSVKPSNPTLRNLRNAEAAKPTPPTLEAPPAPQKDATLETAPSLEGGTNERTEQPRLEDSRPPESAAAQDVPSLEEPGQPEQVRPGSATRGGRSAVVPGGSGVSTPRGDGVSPGSNLPSERGGRADTRGDDESVPRQAGKSDFVIGTDFTHPTGAKTKYRANVAAIQLVKRLESEGRLATQDEQKVLAQFTGWGGLPQAFQWSHEWQEEYRELADVLTDEEHADARASTPNAHYTDPETIRAIYTGLEHLGFTHGRVLEPGAGIGHFLGVMPPTMAARSRRTAIEKDTISARIAKQLYQQAHVMEGAYQEQVLPDGFFDLAIGNVPFADVKPFDPHNKELNKLRFSLHDYYFAKALSQVRPGGLVAFITSRYTMDKVNGKLRDYLAKQADLIGAIRLPNTQFKAIANTEVTTDFIILRKREEGAQPAGEAWGTIQEVPTADGAATVNEYFARHPENIMGRLSLEGSMYRDKEITVAPDGRNVTASMVEAFRRMPAKSYSPKAIVKSVTPRGLLEALQASDDVKEGAYTIQNNALYVRRGSQFVPVDEVGPSQLERAKGLIGLREQVKAVFKSQLEDTGEPFMAAQRKELNKLYDRFQKKFGYVNAPVNRSLFRGDPDYATLQALEKDYDKKKNTAKKADIFTKRVIEYRPRVEKVETAKEAMLVSLSESGRIDTARLKDLTGKTEADLLKELEGVVYLNPEQANAWEPADRYLSGNIRQKLKVAEAAAKVDPRFKANVEALKQAIPEDLKPSDISVKLGHGWIPTDVYRDFIADLMNVGRFGVEVRYSPEVGAFAIKHKISGGNVKNTQTWGTPRYSAMELIEDALASKLPTVRDKDADGKSYVNEKETLLAREKLQAIQDEFRKWLWADPDRANTLARKYNDEFNNVRLQKYDGAHLTLPGLNPNITLRPHQKNAVWRALQDGNTLLAHVVGAGKTYTMIATAMEYRRLRLANKPLYVVPNHLVEYWRDAIKELYPAANVLAPAKEDFQKENRQRLLGRIATGDWDGVVIAHSQMTRLPVSYETFEKFATEQIDILEGYLEELKADKKGNRNIIKEIEKAKERFENKLKARKAALEANSDQGVTFEQAGIDMLLVDEADLFKNLWFPTRMTRVAGLPNSESQRSYDMFLKTNYLNQLTGQRSVIFATGTPISNSMAEAFTMQRYLQPKALEEAGLQHFDSWARVFGNSVTSMELAPDGSGYRPRTRFAEFVNVPELTQMFRQVMDVQDQDDLNLPVPKLRTGKPINVTAKPSEPLKAYVKELIQRAADLKKKRVDPRKDNMLKITGDGRNAALDVRLRVPGAPEDKQGKVALLVKQVVEEHKKSAKDKGTQLVFLDLSTPKGEGKKTKKKGEVEVAEDELDTQQQEVELEEEAALRGSVYQDIKRKLVKAGIPEAEIAFIHDANTDAKKTKLFSDVNAGTVRVLIGSTEKMGAGTNVQKRMVALHNLDAPWRPRDIAQRNGRGIRQGNLLYEADPEGFEFAVFNYATEAPSFDVYMWQTLEAKAKTITQIMKGNPNIRTIQDVDSAVMSFAEMKAIASGNPMILERANKEIELRKLTLLKSAYQDKQRDLAWKIRTLPSDISHNEKIVAAYQKLEAKIGPAEPFTLQWEGAAYDKKTDAGQVILDKFHAALADNPKERKERVEYPNLGTYRGFPLKLVLQMDNTAYLQLGEGEDRVFTGAFSADTKAENMVVRLDNALAKIEDAIADHKKRIEAKRKQIKEYEDEQAKPFEHDEEIKALEARMAEIDQKLDLTKKDENVIAESTEAPALKGPLDILKEERGSIPANPFARTPSKADAEAYRQQRALEEIGFQSNDAEIEKRVRAAKQGMQKAGLFERLKEHRAHVWRLVSREFEHLPDTAQFARLRNDLLKLQKGKGIAADQIQRELASIIKPLTKRQYDQFEWKALLEDLKSEAAADRKLPFGYTAEKVEDDLESLNAAIERDPAVKEAWSKRQALWKTLKKDYQAAMDSIGFDTSKKLTKENYFRHQVLEYARERHLKGTGSKVRTPTGRGFLKARHGSSADINANYVQAEFEVMAQMMYDTQLAQVIAGVDQTLNIQKQLKAEAKTQNAETLQGIIDKGDERSMLVEATLKDFKKRLGMHMSRLRKALELGRDEPLTMAQIADIADDMASDGNLSARGVLKAINERKVFIDEVLGKDKVEWQDLVPETHTLWQPREGNIFYMADSIPAQLAKALQESMLAEVGLPAEKLRKVLAMGGPREQYVIPTEAADTLDQLSHKEHSWFVEANRHFIQHWKALMLTAPRRVIRYIARNTTGDMDAMFVGNPHSFTKLPQAAKELLDVIFKDEQLDGEVKEWVKRGGYGTTLQFQELGGLNELKAFKHTLDRASKGGVLSIPAKVFNGYWKGARLSVDYMETMRRYAAYLSYLEQMQENKGVPKNFGASKRETVMALPDIRDRAFKLSNELLGAYDRVSVAGQTIRDFWVPFFSWMEVNATRYGRLVGNVLDGGQGGSTLARGALITGKNAASFMIRLAFFWSTVQAWNYLLFDDDEEELKKTNPTVANRPHILFGRNDKGEIQYLAGVGALGDLLSWFGLDAFPGLVGDIMHDRVTIGEAIKNAAKAPLNRIWQGLTPVAKLPPELFTRETSYPDVFHWRPIQDRAEYLGYQTTFGPEIRALMGKPGEGLYGFEDLTGLFFQKTDPKSAAYYSWQTTERKHLERMGKESSTIFWRSPRGEALNNWALALKHEDKDAEQVWRDRYIELEKQKYGTRFNESMMYKDIEKSLRSKAPLAGMSRADRDAVVSKLDAQERETLERAEAYYEDTIMAILPAVRRPTFQRKLQSQGWLSKSRPTYSVPALEP